MDSSFVTHRKSKGDDNQLLDDIDDVDDNNPVYISVYLTEVAPRRKFLNVGNTNKLLDVLAWCYDDKL